MNIIIALNEILIIDRFVVSMHWTFLTVKVLFSFHNSFLLFNF